MRNKSLATYYAYNIKALIVLEKIFYVNVDFLH